MYRIIGDWGGLERSHPNREIDFGFGSCRVCERARRGEAACASERHVDPGAGAVRGTKRRGGGVAAKPCCGCPWVVDTELRAKQRKANGFSTLFADNSRTTL